MALAIACWVRDTALETNKREVEYQKAFLSSMIVSNTKFSTAVPGMRGYNRKFDLNQKTSAEKAAKEQEEFFWVYKG
jgi:hypothetical protein